MLKDRKRAKDYIKKTTKTEYNELVEEAFLTVRQRKMLLMKKTDEELANWQIANALKVSVYTIDKQFEAIYDKVLKVIDGA